MGIDVSVLTHVLSALAWDGGYPPDTETFSKVIAERYDAQRGRLGPDKPRRISGDAEWLITRADLTQAVTGLDVETRVWQAHADIGHQRGRIIHPDVVAAEILAALDKMADTGDGPDVPGADVVDAHICCEHAEGTRVSVAELADALKGKLAFRGESAAVEYFGYLAQPEAVAESALEDITGKAHPMPAEAEDEPDEPLSYDPEIQVIATVADALETLDSGARLRVIRWAEHRFSGPPF